MAVAFVSATQEAGTSISSMPSHSAGNVLIFAARRNSSTTPPTIPGTVTTIGSLGQSGIGGNVAMACGYKIAAGSSETSGTWTNASHVCCMVYSGGDGTDPIGDDTFGGSNGTTLTIPALTMQVSDGTSWAVFIGTTVQASADADLLTISGMTRRFEDSAIAPFFAGFDTNAGVSSFAGGTDSGYTNFVAKIGFSVEILQAAAGGVGASILSGRALKSLAMGRVLG